VSLTVLMISHRKMLANYRLFSLAGMYIASGLLILGSILYANKINAGYSFILMIIAGFLYLVGVGMVVSFGGWSFTGEGAPVEGK
jgi:hypothetical protein